MESFRESFLVLYNLLVIPVKNPPVATNTTRPCSTPTFLSSVSLFFLLQLGFYCRHWLTHSSPWVTYWSPWLTYWTPWVIYSSPWVTHWTPWVTYWSPWVIYWTPWVSYWTPWLIYWSPWKTYWGRFMTHFSRFYREYLILLNNSPLFNTLNLKLSLIS